MRIVIPVIPALLLLSLSFFLGKMFPTSTAKGVSYAHGYARAMQFCREIAEGKVERYEIEGRIRDDIASQVPEEKR